MSNATDVENSVELAHLGSTRNPLNGEADIDAPEHTQPNFAGSEFANKAAGFDSPTKLPSDDVQRREWQAANRGWWEKTPMRYDWREGVHQEAGTAAYFAEIDRRFLSSAKGYLSWRDVPFDSLIPFEKLKDKDVLEIGVGQGTHAQLLASRCKSYTGIDLTSRAVNMTSRRLQLFDLPGKIVQMDAEEMSFPDASFDFIWSWGVIHHSSDTSRVLREMRRVLRPGGECTVMVYFRSWWCFYVCGVIRRLFLSQFRQKRDFHEVAQGATDGAIARYYSKAEWTETTRGLFAVESMEVCGLKAEILPLPHGALKKALERLMPDSVSRFLTHRLHMGSFLVARMRRV